MAQCVVDRPARDSALAIVPTAIGEPDRTVVAWSRYAPVPSVIDRAERFNTL
jgi:hypothetical protein